MAAYYEMFEERVLHQSLPCDDLLLLTPEPQSWNSSDSTVVSPVISPNSCDAIIGINANSVPTVAVNPSIPLQNLLQDHSVKVERLNRKAKLARENRKRKNYRLQELETECHGLREEVKRLRQRQRDIALTSRVPDASIRNESHETVLREQVNDIATRVSIGAEENTELKSAITALQDYFTQRGDRSLAQIRACLDSVFQHPQKGPEQFLFWILSRKDRSFFQDSNGMWKSLFLKHLNLEEDQLKELETLGKSAQELRHSCEQVYELFASISTSLESFLSQGRAIVGTTVDILSSEQIAKFIRWVADNQICVNELVLR